jgi:hypothetical protein
MPLIALSYQNIDGKIMARTVFCHIKILTENSWRVLCPVFKILREIYCPHCVLSYQNTEGNSWHVLCSVLSKY